MMLKNDWHFVICSIHTEEKILVPENFIDLLKNNRLIKNIKKHDWHNITQ